MMTWLSENLKIDCGSCRSTLVSRTKFFPMRSVKAVQDWVVVSQWQAGCGADPAKWGQVPLSCCRIFMISLDSSLVRQLRDTAGDEAIPRRAIQCPFWFGRRHRRLRLPRVPDLGFLVRR